MDSIHKKKLGKFWPTIASECNLMVLLPYLPCLNSTDKEQLDAAHKNDGNWVTIANKLPQALGRQRGGYKHFLDALFEIEKDFLVKEIDPEYYEEYMRNKALQQPEQPPQTDVPTSQSVVTICRNGNINVIQQGDHNEVVMNHGEQQQSNESEDRDIEIVRTNNDNGDDENHLSTEQSLVNREEVYSGHSAYVPDIPENSNHLHEESLAIPTRIVTQEQGDSSQKIVTNLTSSLASNDDKLAYPVQEDGILPSSIGSSTVYVRTAGQTAMQLNTATVPQKELSYRTDTDTPVKQPFNTSINLHKTESNTTISDTSMKEVYQSPVSIASDTETKVGLSNDEREATKVKLPLHSFVHSTTTSHQQTRVVGQCASSNSITSSKNKPLQTPERNGDQREERLCSSLNLTLNDGDPMDHRNRLEKSLPIDAYSITESDMTSDEYTYSSSDLRQCESTTSDDSAKNYNNMSSSFEISNCNEIDSKIVGAEGIGLHRRKKLNEAHDHTQTVVDNSNDKNEQTSPLPLPMDKKNNSNINTTLIVRMFVVLFIAFFCTLLIIFYQY